jgi:hypothetical protein
MSQFVAPVTDLDAEAAGAEGASPEPGPSA